VKGASATRHMGKIARRNAVRLTKGCLGDLYPGHRDCLPSRRSVEHLGAGKRVWACSRNSCTMPLGDRYGGKSILGWWPERAGGGGG
jgi:hypothetical protein